MTIGFDGSRAFNKERTGTENYSYQLLKALAKIDKKNQYIVYLRPNTVIPAKAGIQKNSLKSGSPIRSGMTRENDWPENFSFKTIKFPRLWTQIGLAKQTFHDRLDVLFIPAHTSPLIHKPGLKTVVTVHDLGAEYLPKMHQLKQRLYLKWITNYQLKNATKLIAVSNATKADLVKKIGISSNKIKVIYEGYNYLLYRSIKPISLANSLKQFDLELRHYFLFVGTVQPRKNLERLIEAFSQVESRIENLESSKTNSRLSTLATRDLKLVIVGSKGWLSDEIFKLPKKLGIEDQVRFFGRIEDEKMPTLYSGALALTFPSLFEGFGLPILEAQACGCPVITSNLSSMPEVAGEAAILVDPYSVDDIARGMLEVQSSKEKVQSLVKAGFENIKRFSWERCAKETLAVLENL